jgi:hypothetical protein
LENLTKIPCIYIIQTVIIANFILKNSNCKHPMQLRNINSTQKEDILLIFTSSTMENDVRKGDIIDLLIHI